MRGQSSTAQRGHFVGANYHKRLLGDRVRVEAFRQAIEELVEPGMVVADVGSGTGLLALFAKRAGARRVYGIEPAPIVRLARQVARDNGMEDDVVFLETDALSTELPEPVDLVVSECMGNFVVTDEMMPVLADLRRHLAPRGRVCPSRIRLWLAPSSILTFSGVSWWESPVEGLDFSAMRHAALQRAYVIQTWPEELIGPKALFTDLVPETLVAQPTLSGEVELKLDKAGPLTGVIGWFDAELSPNVTLSTGPGIRTHWGQMLFPLDKMPMQTGDVLRFSLSLYVDPDRAVSSWRWIGTLLRDGLVVATSEHCTDDPFGPAA